MKRSIITIDEARCNGCGQCIPGCPEGALQIIDGKARLVSDLFCDGLGACIGTCPQGAIAIEEREAEPYDERRVMANVVTQGANTILAHLRHLHEHGETGYLQQALEYLGEHNLPIPDYKKPAAAHHGGCPGAQARELRRPAPASTTAVDATDAAEPVSELRAWPLQLQLVNPHAAVFDDADLLITADCVPFAYAGFHQRFLRGKTPIIFCPKLDPVIDQYIAKLAAIFTLHAVRSITIVHMEVPCCSGVTAVVHRALEAAGAAIPITEHVISLGGEVLR